MEEGFIDRIFREDVFESKIVHLGGFYHVLEILHIRLEKLTKRNKTNHDNVRLASLQKILSDSVGDIVMTIALN